MDAKRQGEIAVKYVKYYMRKEGIQFSLNSIRRFCAEEIGISVEELKDFIRPLAQEVLDEALR